MRLFIGVRLPLDIRERLARQWTTLSDRPSRLREVESEYWHVTLAFLGDVSAEQRPALEQLLSASLERPPLGSFSLIGIETFPHKGPTTVVARLNPLEMGSWNTFVERMRDMVSVVAPQVDRKPWIPHVTIARAKKGSQLPAWSHPIDELRWQPTSIALILSEPAPHGTRYTDLHVSHFNV
jgi:2'-5' RNA ligase